MLSASSKMVDSRYFDLCPQNLEQASSPDPSPGPESLSQAHSVFSKYLQGQLADVIKAAIWWSTYGVIAQALSNCTLAVGLTRMAFNFALVLLSPIASILVDKVSIESLLLFTTGGRFIIWCVLIPLLWTITRLCNAHLAFNIGFAVLMFLDGAQVAFSNVVDIDCGGLDTLAQQYSLSISRQMRDQFDRIHQVVFDASFIVFTPPCAYLIYKVATWLHTQCYLPTSSFEVENLHNVPPAVACGGQDVAVLLGGICVLFGSLSLFSIYSYKRFDKAATTGVAAPPPPRDLMQAGETQLRDAQESSRTFDLRSWIAVSKQNAKDFKDGLVIVMREKSIRWRLFFLAFETALEDSVVTVIIPQVAIYLATFLLDEWKTPSLAEPTIPMTQKPAPGGWTFINLLAVSCIAVGKMGGLIASNYVNSHWLVPYSLHYNGPYMSLFKHMFVSGISLLLLPVAFTFLYEPLYAAKFLELILAPRTATLVIMIGSISAIVLGFFVFFVFSAIPKIGFATLLHSLILQRDVEAKVFGCVGTCVTLTDAIVILGINFLFVKSRNFLVAIWTVAGIYAFHGLCELIIAPRLILSPYTESNDSGNEFPSMSSYGDPHGLTSTHHDLRDDSRPWTRDAMGPSTEHSEPSRQSEPIDALHGLLTSQ